MNNQFEIIVDGIDNGVIHANVLIPVRLRLPSGNAKQKEAGQKISDDEIADRVARGNSVSIRFNKAWLWGRGIHTADLEIDGHSITEE